MDIRVLFIAVMATFLICGSTLALPASTWIEDKIKERYPHLF